MPTLKEMQEQRGRLVTQAREALEAIKSNTDEARAKELDDRHDAIMAEFDALDRSIAREQKMADIEARAARAEEESRAKKRPHGKDTDAAAIDDNDGVPSYRSVFYKFLRTGADLGELSSEERAVLRTGAVSKDPEKRAQTVGTTTAGGYTVPEELAAIIVKSMRAWGPMYDQDICTEIMTSAGTVIKIPTVDDTGVTAGAHTEGTALTDDGGKDVTFGQKSLESYGFDTEFVKFSLELGRDSVFNMESLLGGLLGERLGRIANSQLTTGTGTSAPNGIVTASSLGKAAAATAAITSDEVIDLMHAVDPAYRSSPKVRFMFNDLTLSALRKLKDSNGAYIWTMGNIQAGVPGTIFGHSYSINQAMDSLAAAKKVMLFGDFSKYFVRKVGAPQIGVLRERFWPDLGIAGVAYFDGELGDTAAVKHLITAAA